MVSEKEILKEEEIIEKQQAQILKKEAEIEGIIVKEGQVLQELNKTRKNFVRKIAKHRFLFTLIVSTGIILVWRGIWEISAEVPFISQSVVALLIGLAILWLIERYSDLG